MEGRLGVRLLNRTNRSVTLTVAGEELQAASQGPLEAIDRALQALNRFRDTPTGHIRLNVLEDGVSLVLGPVLPEFSRRYPDIKVDLSVNNHLVDVTDQGFDAGIRYGGTVPTDMIARRLTPDIRWVVAGAPSYLEQFGTPCHPSDLMHHRCLRIRLGDDRIYLWEFEKAGEALAIDAPGSITIDETQIARILTVNGAGLMYAPEPVVAPYVQAGTLKLVLEDWAPMGAGFYIYYSSRRHLPAGIRLLTDLVGELKPLEA